MTYLPIALAGCLLWALPASASVYSCQSETFCVCQKTQGCSGMDRYLHEGPTQICRNDKQAFEATAKWRKIIFDGEKLKTTFKETRPHGNDFDWYQAGATKDRGLINLNFDGEGEWTNFKILQMAQGSVSNHVWTLSGTCEVIN